MDAAARDVGQRKLTGRTIARVVRGLVPCASIGQRHDVSTAVTVPRGYLRGSIDK